MAYCKTELANVVKTGWFEYAKGIFSSSQSNIIKIAEVESH